MYHDFVAAPDSRVVRAGRRRGGGVENNQFFDKVGILHRQPPATVPPQSPYDDGAIAIKVDEFADVGIKAGVR
jgi:hypothetical protein